MQPTHHYKKVLTYALFSLIVFTHSAMAATVPVKEGNRWIYQYEKKKSIHGGSHSVNDSINEGKLFLTIDSVITKKDTTLFIMLCEVSGILTTCKGLSPVDTQTMLYRNKFQRRYSIIQGVIYPDGSNEKSGRYIDSLLAYIKPPDSTSDKTGIEYQRRTNQGTFNINGTAKQLYTTTIHSIVSEPAAWTGQSISEYDTLSWVNSVGMLRKTAHVQNTPSGGKGNSFSKSQRFTLFSFNDEKVSIRSNKDTKTGMK